MKKACEYCGKMFSTHRREKKSCSDECAKLLRSENVKATCEKKRAAQGKGRKRSKLTITEITVAAKQAGMSYGQYVSKYGL